jgi:hypothetical protein
MKGKGKAEDKVERKPTSIKIDPKLWGLGKMSYYFMCGGATIFLL